ncbi:MAG: NAD(P)-binding domain-containing protein, partial [Chloroflexota bacterium]
MDIAIIGAGNVGGALGALLAAAGHTIHYGVRNATSEKTRAALGKTPGAVATDNQTAVDAAEVIILATGAAVAIKAARTLSGLDGKVVIDATNRVGEHSPKSTAEEVAAAAPGARVVKAFNNQGANIYATPDFNGTAATMFIAGDDTAAKALVTDMCTTMGFDVVDAGGLEYAYHLEKLAELWV